ncbi:MAG: DMT family transporter [Chloroflexota bacterium]
MSDSKTAVSPTPANNAPETAVPMQGYLAATLVILSAATTPIAIRNAQQAGVPSLYMVSVRLITISLVLYPLVRRRHWPALQALDKRDWGLALLSGFFLAANLILLFASLEYTSVLVNGVTRRTTPLWIIWLEIFFLGAAFSWRIWVGLFLALGGAILVAFGSAGAVTPGANPLLGAFLGLLGSVCIGLYMLIGRKLSSQLPSLAYSWIVFAVAAIFATAFAFIRQVPFSGYSPIGYFWVVVVIIIAQFVGHLAINAGLRHFPATTMSIFMQLSVALAAILAAFTLGEIPSLWQLLGSLLIVAGVFFVTR